MSSSLMSAASASTDVFSLSDMPIDSSVTPPSASTSVPSTTSSEFSFSSSKKYSSDVNWRFGFLTMLTDEHVQDVQKCNGSFESFQTNDS
jgi:hypothetical protein